MSGGYRRTPGVALAVLVILSAGLLLGLGAVYRPEDVFPLTLEAVILLGLTVAILQRESDSTLRHQLLLLTAGALAVRGGLAVVLHFGFDPYVFAPDAYTYEYYGQALSDYWRGERANLGRLEGSWQVGYYYLNGFFFYVFGPSGLGPVVLNIFAAVWTALVVFYIGREMRDRGTGFTAALLAAFFPSLILWSVVNIRDALSTLLITLGVFLAMRMRRHLRLSTVVSLVAVLALLSTLRDYMGVLAAGGILLGMVASLRTRRALPTLLGGGVVLIAAVVIAGMAGVLQRFPLDDPLGTAMALRQDLTREAGSAFAEGLRVQGPLQALRFLPLGMAYILFAPFPWAVSSPLQLAALPETLLWYVLVPFTLVGIRRVLRIGGRAALVPLAVAGVVIVSYALVEGNVGTAYRHRAQIMPLLFLFTAVGIHDAWRRHVERTRHRRLRRGFRAPPSAELHGRGAPARPRGRL